MLFREHISSQTRLRRHVSILQVKTHREAAAIVSTAFLTPSRRPVAGNAAVPSTLRYIETQCFQFWLQGHAHPCLCYAHACGSNINLIPCLCCETAGPPSRRVLKNQRLAANMLLAAGPAGNFRWPARSAIRISEFVYLGCVCRIATCLRTLSKTSDLKGRLDACACAQTQAWCMTTSRPISLASLACRRRRRRRAVCEIATEEEGTLDQCRMAHPAGGEACEPFQKLQRESAQRPASVADQPLAVTRQAQHRCLLYVPTLRLMKD